MIITIIIVIVIVVIVFVVIIMFVIVINTVLIDRNHYDYHRISDIILTYISPYIYSILQVKPLL